MRKENFVSSVVAQHRKIMDLTDWLSEFIDERFKYFPQMVPAALFQGAL
jgi:hypothetical protein